MSDVILSAAKDRPVAKRSLAALRMTVLLLFPFALHAQDTTQAYPWRLSYFPYLTVSPNDGVMAMGRVLFFRQSRWDDRVSLHSGVAVEGGYSTKDSWLARVRGDFPRIGEGWRLQAIAQAARTADFLPGALTTGIPATRQSVSVEATRSIGGPFAVALRGDLTHLSLTTEFLDLHDTDVRGRLAIVVDQRDREYDTRSGSLLQMGVMVGSTTTGSTVNTRGSYTVEYGMASGWLKLSERTRGTARVAARFGNHLGSDAMQIMPAWEDEFVVVGGPQSNRALPIGAETDNCVQLASVEIRHDVKVFPGGAIALIGFVDGGKADDCGRHAVTVALRSNSMFATSILTDDWVWGPGAGISLRLLRNAILTATVAHAQGATRVYVSSGWSW